MKDQGVAAGQDGRRMYACRCDMADNCTLHTAQKGRFATGM